MIRLEALKNGPLAGILIFGDGYGLTDVPVPAGFGATNVRLVN
jgi:hypothetical protein